MKKVDYKKSKYYPFFQEAAKIYDHSEGSRLLNDSIKRRGIFPKKLTWEEWFLPASILSYFLYTKNNNFRGDKRLFGISELHIKDLVNQCEKAENFPINNSL